MESQIIVICLILSVALLGLPLTNVVEGQSTTTVAPTGNSSTRAYCFRFTWLGPQMTGTDITGVTCTDILNTYTDTPCLRPLIATTNGNVPNTDLLWQDYHNDPSDIACTLTGSDVCVKYINRYNKQYTNITYGCMKVTIVGEGATTSGCYSQTVDGYETEVCVCRTRAGQRPCNSANYLHHHHCLGSLIVLLCAILFGRLA